MLEIGFGFGGSIPAYPADPGRVAAVVGLDPHAGLLRRAGRRAGAAGFDVHRVRGTAGSLPFPAGAFETVVSQYTLCSLPDLAASLREMARVLSPGGRLLFLEHGLSPEPRVARLQRRLSPLFRWLGDGCRPDIPIDDAIRAAGFHIETLERYEFGIGPRVARAMYRGAARAL